MPSRIDPIPPGEADDDAVNEILRESTDGWWEDSAMMGVMAHCPELVKAIVPAYEAFVRDGRLETRLHELARLKAGEMNRCTYCTSVRTAAVREEVATKEDAVFGTVDGDRLSERERLAVELAEKISGDPNYITEAFFDDVREAFTDEEIVELVFGICLFNFGNKFNVTMTLDTDEESQYPTGLEYPLTHPDDVQPTTED
ncbi:carboxymuconolactone decarboxylase family protein [Natrialbaceae archaeon A-gly3]